MTRIYNICVAGGTLAALALSTNNAWAPTCNSCAPKVPTITIHTPASKVNTPAGGGCAGCATNKNTNRKNTGSAAGAAGTGK
jgi:hypothetical protein